MPLHAVRPPPRFTLINIEAPRADKQGDVAKSRAANFTQCRFMMPSYRDELGVMIARY